MSGRPTQAQVHGWADEVMSIGERIGRHFARSEPRQRAVGYIRGLLSSAVSHALIVRNSLGYNLLSVNGSR